MAIMPHCVACGFDRGYQDTRAVQFNDYNPSWTAPSVVGWSNALGVTAPPGVGFFCDRHFGRATQLRELPSVEAVRLMVSESTRPRRCGRVLARLFRRRDDNR